MAQAWKELESSLKSGDLSDAKKAYETIVKLHQEQVSSSGSTQQGESQMDKDMDALGKALDSGDLSTAQSAFATVQSDMKNQPAPPTSSSSSSSTSSTSSADSEAVIVKLLSTLASDSSSSSSSSSSTSSSSDIASTLLAELEKTGTNLNVTA
jgi:cobalamin biosynthesis Mg chelatase CobN